MSDISLLMSCEHGGHEIPAEFSDSFASIAETLASHQGWDPGALQVAEHLAADLHAPCFSTKVSRLLIDCNRSRGHPRLFSQISRGFSRQIREEIIGRYYLPHRKRIENQIAQAVESGKTVLHLAIHSFVPVLYGLERRADIGLFYDPARDGEKNLCRDWQAELQRDRQELTVRRNYPYQGRSDGLTTFLRSKFDAGKYLGIEIEINQQKLTNRWEYSDTADLLFRTLRSV